MNPSKETLRRNLAEFIHDACFENFTSGDVHYAKLCLLDLIGVGIAGVRQRTSSIIRELIVSDGEAQEATLWGSDRKLPLLSAVLLNAVQGHAIDMDDGHRFANGHPGVVTIPAALALAEKHHLSGRKLIEAIIIGYDMFIRLGASINPDLLLHGFHTTATIGSFSSAAVASKLLGLSVAQTENALALAGLQSAGLLEALSSGEMGKSFQVGKAAQSGVLAGLLAQKGADGPECIFEGDKGFFRAFAGKACDAASVCENLGKEFKISTTYFKKHAACRHIHPALDAISEIVARDKPAIEEIQSIEVDTYSIANNLTGHLATEGSELAAKFSMPVAIGLKLVFGQSDASAFSRQYISDPLVQSIARKVAIHVNPDRDAKYPKRREACVTVHTEKQTYTYEVAYPKGEPENPLSDEEFMDKYEKNALQLYPKNQVARMRDAILNMENIEVSEMAAFLKLSAAG